MIVLQETPAAQTFKITPRGETADSMTLQEEGTTLDPVTYAITLAGSSYYRTITKAVTIEAGKTYVLKVYNEGEEIFRSRIFCLDSQEPLTYSINRGLYTEHEGTFIIR